MRRRLDGVLLLDKPVGLGSNAALQAVKRLYGRKRPGHAGTLDPLASGLLPILFGEATKFSQLALDADKEYLASARLGVTTATADAEGEVLERRPVDVHDERHRARRWRSLRGPIEQVPPMYSALKHAGQPLYALARQGRSVERAARRVHIHELQLLRFDGERPRAAGPLQQRHVRAHAGRGPRAWRWDAARTLRPCAAPRRARSALRRQSRSTSCNWRRRPSATACCCPSSACWPVCPA